MNCGCLIGGVQNAPNSKLWVLILSKGVWFAAHMEPQLETESTKQLSLGRYGPLWRIDFFFVNNPFYLKFKEDEQIDVWSTNSSAS